MEGGGGGDIAYDTEIRSGGGRRQSGVWYI